MKDFKFLKFLDRFKALFEKLGVDYKAMRKILQIKLIMDGRRVPTVFSNNNKKDDETSSNKFFKSLGIYLLMGLILIPFVIMDTNYIYQMSFVFVIITFFIMTSLISDFSSVLLDIKDKSIVGTKPVNLKTLRLAKTIHVSLYMFYITAALVGPALLISLYKQGIIFFLIFLSLIILIDMLIIVLTSLVYFLVLRFFDGEKLKDIINYIQIALTMVLMIGYQLLGRLFSIVDLKIQFVPKWWQYFIIPIWFSAPFQMLKKSEINNTFIIFTIMAIVIPIIAMAIYIMTMPAFEKNLQKLNNNSENGKRKNKKQHQLLSLLLCRSKEERVFFRFASDMMKNEREFKLKVYPTLGFSIIFPFIFLFQQIGFSSFKEVAEGRSYFYIYFCGMMLPTVMMMIKYSERYKGAWIYKAVPINSFVPVFKGAIKAYIAKLFLPLFLLDTIIFVLIFGIRILPDMLIVLLNTMIFNILCFAANKKTLPFSEAFGSTKENGMLNLVLALGLAVLAGIHFLSTNINYGVYVYIVLAAIANLLLWKYAFKIAPDKINQN
ncbi:hypothetical protein CSC2_04250 [Clostridium zeae]|uniref:ABC transporter permease n=1 Tax=Clostridium zeae TaxID=2759022 RepID=A0ABQ1E594_9CLOT|nr:hypothetical protein [Clostridium zeae]GFZ29899.1 hypothetical protein CSC2_04250 [Clostridium zeae]